MNRPVETSGVVQLMNQPVVKIPGRSNMQIHLYSIQSLRRYIPIVLVMMAGITLTIICFCVVEEQSKWAVMASGVSLTGLVSGYLAMLLGRTVEVEKQVIDRTIGMEREVAERKHAEEMLTGKNQELLLAQAQLREVNQHLEERVEQRTSEITKLLKQKEDFISQLGHDLRSPLTPLVGLVPLFNERETDPEAKELLDVITRNVNYMKNLVEKTLQLAKLNSMDATFDIYKVNLAKIVDDLIQRKHFLFVQSDIIVENRIEETTTVYADKLRLLEVFDNLASNAIKFMPDGGLLKFEAWENGKFATVSVSDTGTGISKGQLTQIFDEFFKVDESRHDLHSSGLGLTICKRILEKHGGQIWAESEGIGRGTAIHFTVPLGAGEVCDDE